MPTIHLGVDIAKESFVAARWCGSVGQTLGQFVNAPDGFEQLARTVDQVTERSKGEPVHVVLEPTGG